MTSSERESSSTQSEFSSSMPDYVALLLVHPNGSRVLMAKSAETWYLPQLTYPKSLNYNVDRCCKDLQHRLSIDAPGITAFSASVELLGSYASAGFEPGDEIGFARLFLLESHVPLSHLPPPFAWKDAQFLSSCLDTLDAQDQQYHFFEQSLLYIAPKTPRDLLPSLDPRHKLGWFREASAWLRSVVSSTGASPSGRVVQVHVNPTSTILKIDSTCGWFYLKSLGLASHEPSITAALADLISNRCVQVIAVSDLLHSFVTPGFELVDLDEAQHLPLAAHTLGEIQLQCMAHVEPLRAAGCPDHTPLMIERVLLHWAESETIRRIFGSQFPSFVSALPHLLTLCQRLSTSKMPPTLVHGDYALRNMTFSSASQRELLIFDWQYACISHPFCDMHILDDLVIEDDEDGDENCALHIRVRNEYMQMLAECVEGEADLQEEYNAGRVIGNILQMWTTIESLEKNDVQLKSALEEFVFDSFNSAVAGVRQLGMISN